MPLTGLAFLGAYLGSLALALVRHPRFGLYAYLAVFYLDPPSRWWGTMLPPIRWSLLAAVVMFLATLRLKPRRGVRPWYTTTPAKILIAYTVWMWIQNLWALAPDEHLDGSVLFTKYIVLFAVIYRLMDTPGAVRECLSVHYLGCAYLGWLAYIAPPGGRLEGVGGPGIDEANALGMFIATGVVCGAMLILRERGWRQWLAVAVMPFLLNAIVQSQSRGAMLALLIGGLVLFYLKPKPYARLFYVFGVLGIVLFGIVAQGSFWNRMRTLEGAVDQTAEMDSSAESRIVIAKAQIQMALDYPLGVGHRGTAVLSPRYLDERWLTKSKTDPTGVGARSSHNTFMSALVEQGVPGALLFAGLMLWIVRSVFALKRVRDRAADPRNLLLVVGPAAVAALVVVIVAGNFTDYLKTEVQIWMMAILSSLLLVLWPAEEQPAAATDAAAPAAARAGVVTGVASP